LYLKSKLSRKMIRKHAFLAIYIVTILSILVCRSEPVPKRGTEQRPRRAAAATKKTPEPELDDMEESDDDDSSSDEEEMKLDMETLNQSHLIKDDEDRKHLDSLPEIEREAILAERFEQRKAEFDMKQALRESKRKKREEKKSLDQTKKRKAPASTKATKKSKEADTSKDQEIAQKLSSRRSSTRDRDVTGKKGSKTKALAALREVSSFDRRVICLSPFANYVEIM
jgi:RNA polymerase-associated protein RTF1